MTLSFDIMVIGGGPGGYIASIRAAQLGMSVACCEYNPYDDPAGEPRLGGTCLNAGCIPLKALVASSEAYEHATTHFAAHGISVSGLSMDVTKMQKRKESIVRRMTAGIQFLFKKNNVTLLKGRGSFVGKSEDGYRLLVVGKEGETEITARNVIIATGSTPRHLPNITVDNLTICDNVGALKLSDVPKRLAIIGAGVIGLEVGSVWRRLGAEVTLLEMLPTLLPFADESIATEAAKLFKKQGLNIVTSISISEIKHEATGVSIAYSDKDGNPQSVECDKLMLSIGRTPSTNGLNLEAIGLQPDARGFIPVNEQCTTTIHGIYAIGDVVRGPMLAHKAEDEGVMVAEIIAGQHAHINYNAIPSVISLAQALRNSLGKPR